MSTGNLVTGSARGKLRWFQWDEMEEHLAISSQYTITGDQGQGKCTDHSHWEAQVCSNSKLLPGHPRRASWAGWGLLGSSSALSHGLFNPLIPTAPQWPLCGASLSDALFSSIWSENQWLSLPKGLDGFWAHLLLRQDGGQGLFWILNIPSLFFKASGPFSSLTLSKI